MDDAADIQRTTSSCVRLLDSFARDPHGMSSDDDFFRWINDQTAKLRAWAASLGVYAREISQLLEALEACLRIIQTSRAGTKAVQQAANNAQVAATANIALLLDIAIDLRRLGSAKEEQRALHYEPMDGRNESLLPVFEHYASFQCRQHLLRSRVLSNPVFASSRTANAPPATDLGDRKRMSSQQLSVWLAEGTVGEHGTADQAEIVAAYVYQRMCTTILQRWRLLCYRAKHAKSLMGSMDPDEPDTVGLGGARNKDATQERSELTLNINTASRSPAPGTVISSVATQVSAGRQLKQSGEKTGDAKTAMTGSSGVALRDSDFPRKPKCSVGSDTLCPLCWIPIPAEKMTGRQWKSHVLSDLAPYFCVFQDCPTPNARFSSPRLLRQHFDTRHCDKVWTCVKCRPFDGTTREMTDPNQLLAHLERYHASEFTASDREFLIKHGFDRRPQCLLACPFCGGLAAEEDDDEPPATHWTMLVNHMVKDHMQSLAMISLPWNLDASDQDSDTKASSSEDSLMRQEDELEDMRESGPIDLREDDVRPSDDVSPENLTTINEHSQEAVDNDEMVLNWRTRMPDPRTSHDTPTMEEVESRLDDDLRLYRQQKAASPTQGAPTAIPVLDSIHHVEQHSTVGSTSDTSDAFTETRLSHLPEQERRLEGGSGLSTQNLATLSSAYDASGSGAAGQSTGTVHSSNSDSFNTLLQQFNELQQQTLTENLEVQKAQAFWNPLESMSKKDAGAVEDSGTLAEASAMPGDKPRHSHDSSSGDMGNLERNSNQFTGDVNTIAKSYQEVEAQKERLLEAMRQQNAMQMQTTEQEFASKMNSSAWKTASSAASDKIQ